MSPPSIKRRALINRRLCILYTVFVVLSVFVVLVFIADDYRLASETHANATHAGGRELVWELDSQPDGVWGVAVSPWRRLVLGAWLFTCILLAVPLYRRLRPVFWLYAWLAFGVTFVSLWWSIFVGGAMLRMDNPVYSLIASVGHSGVVRAWFLILWGFLSTYLAFAYLNAKHLGIFARMDRLFAGIRDGDLGAELHFRRMDRCDFLADSFNTLKNKYVGRLKAQEDALRQVSEKLQAGAVTVDDLQALDALLEPVALDIVAKQPDAESA